MSDFVLFFFDLINNIKFYHWTTTSYSRHKGSDELFKELVELTDKFMEVYMGKYGRPKISERDIKSHKLPQITLKTFSDKGVIDYVKSSVKTLQNDLSQHLKDSDVELINIRDEILAKLNQTLYLFSLQ